MSNEQQVPVWYACVGEGYEPVLIGEMALASDEVLRTGGWVQSDIAGFRLISDSLPRRRRKPERFVVIIRNSDGKQTAVAFVKAGQCMQVDSKGELILIDKPAEGQVEQ